ncbi:luciferase, putative [Pediculus humanus corporis]|uniref:Luciferase, putative n=1 Tax=Pediculus humanus subsp. corporis TaxID=121224 RepID=E0W0P5_PEDHC|nr:luciferase, putative [Pediculus humanus corporis]EEB19201.1 luciferase, putative [Pediculus humanus corporis]
MTRKDFVELAVAFAEKLKEENIQKGDYIALVGNNGLFMNVALIGILFMGAVPFPITYKTSLDEFHILFKKIKPKYFGCDGTNVIALKNALAGVEAIDTSKIFVLDHIQGIDSTHVTFHDFIKNTRGNVANFQPAMVDNVENDIALIIKGLRHSTYGKAIGITHSNFNTLIASFEDTKSEINNVILMCQKVMWMSGIYSLIWSTCFNSKLIIMSKFEEESFVSAIEKYKVTSSYLYSSRFWQLYKYNYSKEYDLSSCKNIYGFDGYLPHVLVSGLKEKLNLTVQPCYAASELTGVFLETVTYQNNIALWKLKPSFYGKVIPNEKINVGGPTVKGEICIKGPQVTKGYINDSDSNRQLFDKEGFFHTGLYGYYNHDGYFIVIDNIYYVIKYKQHKISPKELEGIIKSLEPVKDALVSGIKHPRDGYYPIAFVTLQKGKNMTAGEIINYVNNKVEDHSKLRGGVIFVPKIPRSRETGALNRKLVKNVLSRFKICTEVDCDIEINDKPVKT